MCRRAVKEEHVMNWLSFHRERGVRFTRDEQNIFMTTRNELSLSLIFPKCTVTVFFRDSESEGTVTGRRSSSCSVCTSQRDEGEMDFEKVRSRGEVVLRSDVEPATQDVLKKSARYGMLKLFLNSRLAH